MIKEEQLEIDMLYTLLKELPLYPISNSRSMRSWMEIVGVQKNTFNALVDKGWFIRTDIYNYNNSINSI